MKRLRRRVLLPLLLLALAGCSARATTKEEFLAGTADTAYAVKEGGETVFWKVPRFLFWTAPKAIVWDLPGRLVLALSGPRARVAALVDALRTDGVPVEEEVAISGELREITGIPIQSAARWRIWWKENRDRSWREWRRRFAEEAIGRLGAPDYFERVGAIEDLKAMYGTDLDYDPKGSPDAIAAGTARWRRHYEEHGLP